jgi:hypothetical protein
MYKKGVSQIVTTVLIILVSVILATTLFFAGKAAIGKINQIDKNVYLEIVTSEGYTVWDNNSRLATVQIRRGQDSSDAVGVDVIFSFEGNSVTHFVLDMPARNSKMVYKINLSNYLGELSSIKIIPVFIDGSLGETANEISLANIVLDDLSSLVDAGEIFETPTGISGSVIVSEYFGGGGGGGSATSEDDGDADDGVIDPCVLGCSGYTEAGCSVDFCGFGNCIVEDGACVENVSSDDDNELILPTCGNNILEMGEVCDGSDLGTYASCSALPGFVSGAVVCDSDCLGLDLSGCQEGSVVYANSCEQDDVQSVIDSAVDGDTVIIPEGECVWKNALFGADIGGGMGYPGLIINKSIILHGAGIGETIITDAMISDLWGRPTILIDDIGEKPFRITGIEFGNITNKAIIVDSTSKNWRIDNCKFNNEPTDFGGWRYIVDTTERNNYGLFDNNELLNSLINIQSDDIIAWDRPLTLGTSNAVYIEDNSFYYGSAHGLHEDFCDAEAGARIVVRHNDVTNSHFHIHGNDGGSWRSTHSWEFYNNTLIAAEGINNYRFGALRGGTGVVFDNVATGNWGPLYATHQCVYREDCYMHPSGDFTQDCTEYPCTDQIGRTTDHDDDGIQDLVPVFEWGNLVDGADKDIEVQANLDPMMSDIIQEGRDFYNDAVTFDSQLGAYVATYIGDDGQTKDWSYRPYPYPHPLTLFGPEVNMQSYDCANQNILCVDDTAGEFQEYFTIQSAVDDAGPGDTVLVRDGYYFESVVVDKDGTQDNYIKVLGYPGEKPKIECEYDHGFLVGGYSPDHGRDWIWIENFNISNCYRGMKFTWANGNGNNNIVVKDMEISNCVWDGIYLGGSGGNWLVENNVVHDVGGHCLKFAEYEMIDVTILNNTVWNCGFHNDNTNSGRHPYGIQVSYMDGYENAEVSNFLIKDNVIHDTWQAGINFNVAHDDVVIEGNELYNNWINVLGDLGTGMGAIQLGPRQINNYNITISGNKIYNSEWRGISSIRAEVESYLQIYDNVIFDNRRDGIYVGNDGNTSVDIQYNTFYNNGESPENYSLRLPYRSSVDLLVKNNIFYNLNDVNIRSDHDSNAFSNNLFDYNLYYVPGVDENTDIVLFYQLSYQDPWTITEFRGQGMETNGLVGDPQFNDVFSHNFKPDQASMACGNAESGRDIGATPC